MSKSQRSDAVGEIITFKTFDGLQLEAQIVPSKLKEPKGTIIMLHGIRAYKSCFNPFLLQLQDSGYNAVALDLRAHGNSEGNYCTFGVHEKKDVSSLLDVLDSMGVRGKRGIWGQSLGGAIALQALAYDKRLEFGVVESTFADYPSIAHDYFRRSVGFRFPLLMDYLIKRSGELANFNPIQANPREACSKITQPVFMAHGAKDSRIKIEYGRGNFDALQSTDKSFISLANANHLNVWATGGEKYKSNCFQFIELFCLQE